MEILVRGTLNGSADSVWKTVGDFGSIHTYLSYVDKCTVDGQGVGAVRTLYLTDGTEFQERLESLDEAQHRLSFSFVDMNTPLQNYLCTLSVRDLAEERSEIEFASQFDPTISEAEARTMLEDTYNTVIDGLKQKFNG